ncbi:MAG: PTS sugar transporter subunit IIB [Longicatena sp.]
MLLVCGTGASSGFMAKNIRQAAKARGIEIGVKARSDSTVEDYIEEIDLLLVGPHLSYMIDDLKEIADPHDVPVDIIPKELYGNLDGNGVLDFALNILK